MGSVPIRRGWGTFRLTNDWDCELQSLEMDKLRLTCSQLLGGIGQHLLFEVMELFGLRNLWGMVESDENDVSMSLETNIKTEFHLKIGDVESGRHLQNYFSYRYFAFFIRPCFAML